MLTHPVLGEGLGAITLNRPPGGGGYSHGGVALIYRAATTKAKRYSFPNPESFEVLCSQLNISGVKRKLYVISAYMPPNYRIGRARSCIRYISDIILYIKDKVDDPLIHLAGDFNQWDVVEALLDYPDIIENSGGPTRKDRTIDRCFTNFSGDISETKVLRPLETEANDVGYKRKSDHRIVLTCASIDKIPLPNWKKITFRPYHETGASSFESWANSQNWEDVLLASGTHNKANALQFMLDDAMNCFFPEKND